MQLQTIHVVGRMIGQTSGDTPDVASGDSSGVYPDGYGTGAYETVDPGSDTSDTTPATTTPKPSTGSGWPPARPFVAAAWRETADGPRYVLQSGDTFAGLAWTYLGDPARWNEIASLNPQHDASHWPAGALIVMPDEAIAYAIQHKALPEGAGGVDSSQYGAGATLAAQKKSIGIWPAVAIAAATAGAGAVVTVIVYKAFGA